MSVAGKVAVLLTLIAVSGGAFWTTIQKGVQYISRLHQVPCSQCTYFTGDYRLKCPVHPIEALTEEAIACRDYECRKASIDYAIAQPIARSYPKN
ncbi:MAG: hypothetical protein F6K30_00640 [Cyanothece sp. SIO2G6]|nr:hypothetical protein [Cyanothece sp. SIO2G6]